MLKSVQLSERDYLLTTYLRYKCTKVNVCYIKNYSDHFHTNADDKRYAYTANDAIDEFVRSKPKNTVTAISTTFYTTSKYISIIGFDVELVPSADNLAFLSKFLRQYKLKGSIFRTMNGYHLFLNELYDNDFDLITREFELIWAAGKSHGDDWVEEYYKEIKRAQDYKGIKLIARTILKNVGHAESGMYTVFDMRHMAYGYTVNERRRNLHDDGKLRTQHFFRIEKRNDKDFDPYLVFTTE